MFVYVGCRTSKERNARGEGINVYRMDAETGRLTHVQLLGALINPSFMALNSTGNRLYCAHGDREDASSFLISPKDGTLTYLNTQGTKGLNPAHVAVDPSDRFLVISNHYGGSLAVLSIRADGSLGELVEWIELAGEIGPHRIEQKHAKPHFNPFDPNGQYVIVPDKGLDRIFSFRFDAARGKLTPTNPPYVATREGAGPRHVAFHPRRPIAYAINELDSTVTSYRYAPATGALTPFQILSALPDTYTGNSRAAEIEVSADGRFLYASNRGYDSIAIFAIDAKTGHLTFLHAEPTQGATPRFFALSPCGKFLFAANEDSDSIVTFRVDKTTGQLRATGEVISTGSPVCIVFGRNGGTQPSKERQ